MSIKFKNAFIVNKDFELLKSHDLIVENDRIKDITPSTDVDDDKHDRVIDCTGDFLIPGFKNAHAHNAMVFARSLTDDVKFDEWLQKRIQPLEAKLTEEDVYYFTILGIMENLSSGITACADMYMYYYTIADACLHTGFRVNIIESLTKYDKVIAPEEFYNTLNNYKGDNGNLIKYTFGLHAEYSNDKDTFKLISDMVHKYKKPFFSHNSETKKEVDECRMRWGGLTPTEVHEEYGLYDYGGGGYHCLYLSENDIEIFKKHKLYVVTNAASNLKLVSGIAPIKKYVKEGINIAIGTDGPASNNTIDMFREMFLISNLSKYLENDPAALNTRQIVNMTTKNSAACIGEPDTDSLEIGKKADIVVIDVNTPNMQPKNDFVNNLVYACGKQNVKITMVDGKILYENGKYFINEDERYIYKKCNELLKNLKERGEC